MTLSGASSSRASRSTSKSTKRNEIAAGLERGPPFSFAPRRAMNRPMADDAMTLEQAADRAAASGDSAAASRLLEQAVERTSDKPGLWMKLSAMRRAGGDLGGALEAVERALAIQPLDFSALLS